MVEPTCYAASTQCGDERWRVANYVLPGNGRRVVKGPGKSSSALLAPAAIGLCISRRACLIQSHACAWLRGARRGVHRAGWRRTRGRVHGHPNMSNVSRRQRCRKWAWAATFLFERTCYAAPTQCGDEPWRVANYVLPGNGRRVVKGPGKSRRECEARCWARRFAYSAQCQGLWDPPEPGPAAPDGRPQRRKACWNKRHQFRGSRLPFASHRCVSDGN